MNMFDFLMAGLLGLSNSTVGGGDPCLVPGSQAMGVQIQLKSSALNEGGVFVGVFDMKNTSKNEPFVYGFFRHGNVDLVARPYVAIEYLDVSGQWILIGELPGSFRDPPYSRALSPGKSTSFSARLVTADTAKRSARSFRLLLRSRDFERCARSMPFQGLPERPSVIRLQSSSGL